MSKVRALRGKPIPVVCAAIFSLDNSSVLLSTRDLVGLKDFDGKWQLPGGKIEFGETPEEALKREIRKEVGAEIIDLVGPTVGTELGIPNKHYLLLVYACHIAGSLPSLATEKLRWFTFAQLPQDNMVPHDFELLMMTMHRLTQRVI